MKRTECHAEVGLQKQLSERKANLEGRSAQSKALI